MQEQQGPSLEELGIKQEREVEKEEPNIDILPETVKEEEKVRRDIMAGLGELYEILPRSEKVSSRAVEQSIEQTTLSSLFPGVKIPLATAIENKRLNLKEKNEFISACLEVQQIQAFILTRGVVNAIDKEFTSKNNEKDG